MKRLYLRIYLAVLASLAVLALVAGLIVHQFTLGGPPASMIEAVTVLASNVLATGWAAAMVGSSRSL